MVQPQRGQREVFPAQVVPQDEQVLVQLPQVAPRLFTQLPSWVVQVEQVAALSAQAEGGNKGKLKNSSHTFSANSSQGGMLQKP